MAKKTMREIIAAAAAAGGSSGFSIAELEAEGYARRRVDSAVNRMVADGLLHKGKTGHRTMRLFLSKEWAGAYEARRRPVTQREPTHTRMKANWAPGQEAIYPVDDQGNPLYKFTSSGISDEDLRRGQIANQRRWNGDAVPPWGGRL